MTSSTPTPPGTPGSSGDRPGPGLRPPDPPGGRRAVLVWSVGVSVYFVAIIFRTSLGVAGLDAADRFEINASALSTFSILQLLVYAGMQIPVGLMVDRVGTKRVLTWGVILFTLGQLGFAFFPHYGMALVSRALLGCGDAMTFISVLRLGSRWFPARRGPLVGQLAGLVGMAGNLVSTLVLARLLHGIGWEAAFGGSALLGVLVLGLMLLFLKDHPEGHAPPPVPKEHRGAAFVRHQIARSWAEPGTRLGLWTHFTTQFPAMVYLLLWGLPYLVEAQGMTRAEAGELLTLVVLANMVIGLVYGQLIARNHRARSVIVLGTVLATAACWAAVLSWPGTAPAWLLLVHAMVLGACGPASMVGFDFARPANPPERQGTASGIVNMGGFTASMTSLLAIGVLLDLTGDNYRVAFSVLLVLQAFGTAQILRLRRAALRRESERLVASRVETVHVPA